MSGKTPSSFTASAGSLARLLGLGVDADADIEQDVTPDTARQALLAAKLDSPPAIAAPPAGEARSLRELLLDGRADVAELEQVKALAKPAGGAARGRAEEDVWLVVYFAAIAAALRFRDRVITRHAPDALDGYFRMLMLKPWLPEELVEHFRQAAECCERLIQGEKSAAGGEGVEVAWTVRSHQGVLAEGVLAAEAEGLVFGRGPDSDVRLVDDRVSARHARLFYCEELGQWMIEDLGSTNGVLVEGRRIDRPQAAAGRRIALGPCELAVWRRLRQSMPTDPGLGATVTVVGARDESAVLQAAGAGDEERLSTLAVRRLNEIGQRLSQVTHSSALYGEFCRALTAAGLGEATVVRLTGDPASGAGGATVLAQGLAPDPAGVTETGPRQVPLSRRVVRAVREGGLGVVARSAAGPGELGLTVVRPRGPRAVVCVPIEHDSERTEAIYLETPDRGADGEDAGATLDFLRAAVRLVRLSRSNLLAAEDGAKWHVHSRLLELAAEIQTCLLPAPLTGVAGVDVAWFYQPAIWVGGDYCDVWALSDGRVVFVVADVCGKGLPAAIVMAGLHATLRALTRAGGSPAEAVGQVNHYLLAHMPEGTLVSMVLGFYEPATGRLSYVNAGHEAPVVIGPDDEPAPLGDSPGLILGLDSAPCAQHELVLAPGQGLLAVTDGITESRGAEGELFGLDGVTQALRGAGDLTGEQIVHRVVAAAAEHRQGRGATDDVTALCLRRTAGTKG